MNKNKLYVKILTLCLCICFLSACSVNSQGDNDNNPQLSEDNGGITENSETVIEAENMDNNSDVTSITLDSISYDSDDYYSDWEDQDSNYIELIGDSANITGQGADVDNNKVTITSAGIYVISGKMDDGQIIVDTEDEGTVRLVLNGADIQCLDSAPIYVKNADKTVITLQEGTENIITDGESYVLDDPEEDEPNAAIFSKDDLTINGTGTLTVNGNYNNGITGKDDLKITGGNIYIYSVDDGLMGRDMIGIKDGNITIEAGGDALKSTNDEDSSKGFIGIEGGSFNLTAGADGIQAETSVIIAAGDFTIATGGGSINSTAKADSDMKNPWDREDSDIDAQVDETDSQSAKGIKASDNILISGGTFDIDSSDDAIHSNNWIEIEEGVINIASGDDGIHADSDITIKGGEIKITDSYEGIESGEIYISDGNIDIIAKDDGINLAGGNDGSSINGRPGQNSFIISDDYQISIDGGYILIDASGDGIDSNGSIYMTDGTVIVNGPTDNKNGAIDYDGVFEINGGTLIAAGSLGMAQGPSQGSTQYSIFISYDTVQQEGTLVHIEDEEGNSVITFTPDKQYQSIVISSPDLKEDIDYTLFSGGTSTGNEKDGLYTDGEYRNGSEITNFTLSDVVTWLSESGVMEGELDSFQSDRRIR